MPIRDGFKRLLKRNVKKPSMQRWQCQSYNGTLQIMNYILMFIRLKNVQSLLIYAFLL